MPFERSINICILEGNRGAQKIFTDLKETLIGGKSDREPAMLFKPHIYQIDLEPANLVDVFIAFSFTLFLFVFFFPVSLACSLSEKNLSPKDLKMRSLKILCEDFPGSSCLISVISPVRFSPCSVDAQLEYYTVGYLSGDVHWPNVSPY